MKPTFFSMVLILLKTRIQFWRALANRNQLCGLSQRTGVPLPTLEAIPPLGADKEWNPTFDTLQRIERGIPSEFAPAFSAFKPNAAKRNDAHNPESGLDATLPPIINPEWFNASPLGPAQTGQTIG